MFNLTFQSRNLRECQLEVSKHLFLTAFKKHRGNMRAIKHDLKTSVRQVYKLKKMFDKKHLRQLLIINNHPGLPRGINEPNE